MDLESLRLITIIGSLAAIMLYIYRIVCTVNLMRSDSPKLEGYNRLIYAGLIFIIPLGIGAWIYDFVVNNKKVSPLFLFPFAIVVTTFIQGMIILLPHVNKFNFDYIGW
ncbi:hypothetical protein [Glaciecola sp. 1036]|uniref:hypothetical protein n=1 Tax=Alteromonadaceae TaxID=72275 RepID=UPI003CFD06FE